MEKKNVIQKNNHGLCHRCEYRAKSKEGNFTLRYECGTDGSSGSCYAHKPPLPITVEQAKGDTRPMFAGSLISSRVNPVGVVNEEDWELHVLFEKKGKKNYYTLYWVPKKGKKK